MGITNRVKIVKDICAAVGIDSSRLISLTLRLDKEIPRIEAVYILENDRSDSLVEVLRTLQISEAAPDKAT